MKIIKSLQEIPETMHGGAVTIGNFDGLHLGHQMILSRLLEAKRELGIPAIVITFEPHPKGVLNPHLQPFHLITTLEEKLSLLAQMGIDATIVIPFDKDLAAMAANDFVKSVLCTKLGVKKLFIGHDYAFGKNKSGNVELLRDFARAGAFELQTIDAYKNADGNIVSSTAVRRSILSGDLLGTNSMLGRFYGIKGDIVHGVGRGGKIGFPTANIIPNKTMLPPQGVYATLVNIDFALRNSANPAKTSFGSVASNGAGVGKTQFGAQLENAQSGGTQWGGALNIGNNPTFGGERLSVEVFIIGYDGDLYGKNIAVKFVERIRGELAFASVTELITQIKTDVARIKMLLMPLLSRG